MLGAAPTFWRRRIVLAAAAVAALFALAGLLARGADAATAPTPVVPQSVWGVYVAKATAKGFAGSTLVPVRGNHVNVLIVNGKGMSATDVARLERFARQARLRTFVLNGPAGSRAKTSVPRCRLSSTARLERCLRLAATVRGARRLAASRAAAVVLVRVKSQRSLNALRHSEGATRIVAILDLEPGSAFRNSANWRRAIRAADADARLDVAFAPRSAGARQLLAAYSAQLSAELRTTSASGGGATGAGASGGTGGTGGAAGGPGGASGGAGGSGGGAGGSADTQAPTAPAELVRTGFSQTTISVAWQASTDNVAVATYRLHRGGDVIGTTATVVYTFSGLTCGTGYTLGVEALDAAGNASSRTPLTTSTGACAQAPPAGDTQPPTAPTGMAFTAKTQTSVTVGWSGATDDVGVVGYHLYRNSVRIASTSLLGYTFGALACGTSYTFALGAYDAAGNVSNSAEATGTIATDPCDAPPPPPSPPPPPGDGFANLWVDLDGGTCTRSATLVAYDSAAACASFAGAYLAASGGDTVRVKAGTYPGKVTVGGTKTPAVTFIGEPETVIDSGTGKDNGLTLIGNVIIDAVNIAGDYPQVWFREPGNSTWRNSRMYEGRQERNCGNSEPVMIYSSSLSFTVSNSAMQNIVIEAQRAAPAGEAGACAPDGYHLEQLRIDGNVDGVLLDRVTFEACLNGAGYNGCGSGQVFVTSPSTMVYPRNLTIRNSIFKGGPNYWIQTHTNVSVCNGWTIAYNTFKNSSSYACGSRSNMLLVGNLGTEPQNCVSGTTYTKNVWQWSTGTPCGTDTRVTGTNFQVNQLGLNADFTLAAGSPAIDAAETAGYCTTSLGSVDRFGNTRPVGAAGCDAGAHERS